MDRAILSSLLLFTLLTPIPASGISPSCLDTVWLRQQLYNGRVWESRYDQVMGSEFFLTEALTKTSVTVDGRIYSDQLCWYDICNDQLILMAGPGNFIEANRRRVEEFTMYHMNQNYRFVNFGAGGYCHVLHQGRVFLVIKYSKVIKKKAVDNRYDAFMESQHSYIVKDSTFIRLSGRKDLFIALADKEDEIRHYIRENGIHPNIRKPQSLIAVLRYYDSL